MMSKTQVKKRLWIYEYNCPQCNHVWMVNTFGGLQGVLLSEKNDNWILESGDLDNCPKCSHDEKWNKFGTGVWIHRLIR